MVNNRNNLMLRIYKNQKNSNKRYLISKKRLRQILGDTMPIEHVGSTAVPDMNGKGIIDILIGLEDENKINEVEEKLINFGYFESNSGRKAKDYAFLASSKEETKPGDVHIHLAIVDTDRFDDFIRLRNYLRKYPDIAKKYSDLKYKIAKQSNFERNKYKEIKSEFVSNLIKEARNNG